MNTDNNKQPGAEGNTAQTSNSNNQPAAPPEQTVAAKLLFRFLKPFPHTYEQWITSLRSSVATAEALGRRENLNYRGIVSVDGEDAITWRFAHGLTLLSCGLPGTLVSIALRESREEPYPSIDSFLNRYRTLVVDGRVSGARALHEFLQVEHEFDPWIKRNIKALHMKFRRDYNYAEITGVPVPKQMYMTIAMAERIVMATTTPRALQAQKLLAESEARRKSCMGAG